MHALADSHARLAAGREATAIASVRLAVWGEPKDVEARMRDLNAPAAAKDTLDDDLAAFGLRMVE